MSDRGRDVAIVLLWCAAGCIALAGLLYFMAYKVRNDEVLKGQLLDGGLGMSAAGCFLAIAGMVAEFG